MDYYRIVNYLPSVRRPPCVDGKRHLASASANLNRGSISKPSGREQCERALGTHRFDSWYANGVTSHYICKLINDCDGTPMGPDGVYESMVMNPRVRSHHSRPWALGFNPCRALSG